MSLCRLPNRSAGITLIELLVALAIVLALAAILISVLFSFRSPVSQPPVTRPLIGSWTTTVPSAQVGQQYTFTYTLQQLNPLATTQAISASANTEIQFVSGPGTVVTIVSLNGAAVNSDRGRASTDAAGNVNVVIQATSVPPNAQGALVAVPVGRSEPVAVTRFEIFQ